MGAEWMIQKLLDLTDSEWGIIYRGVTNPDKVLVIQGKSCLNCHLLYGDACNNWCSQCMNAPPKGVCDVWAAGPDAINLDLEVEEKGGGDGVS